MAKAATQLRTVEPDPVDVFRRFESDQRFEEIRRNAWNRQLRRQRIQQIAWVVAFTLVVGLSAVAVAIVAVAEVARG